MSPDPMIPAESARPISLPGSTGGRRIPAGLKNVGIYLLIAALCSGIGVALVILPEKLVFAGVVAVGSVFLVLFRPYSGLLLYAAALFLRPAEIWPVLGPLHLERLIGVLTLASIVLNNWFGTGRLTMDWSRQTRWLGAFWIATFLTMPTSYWPTRSVDMAIEILKIIAFYVMVVSLVNTRLRLKVFIWMYVGIVVYFALTALKDYYTGSVMFAQGIERVVGETSSSGDPNTLGATMACTIPLLLMLFNRIKGFLKRSILGVSFLGCTWTLALSGSRAALLGFLGGLGLVWWMSSNRFRNGIILCSLLAIGFVNLPEQYQERYESIGNTQVDESSQGRINAWKAGLRMIADRPFLGVGVGCFAVAYGTAYGPGHWLQPHSLYIQVPAEAGMLGAVTFFGFLFQAVKTNRRSRKILGEDQDDGFEKAALDGMLVGFFVLAICGLFGHSMLRPTWYLFAALGQASYRILTQESGQTAG